MRLKSAKGFTLLEMIMVFVILGIIMTILVPHWGKYMTYWDLDTEAARIVAKIRETQAKAIATQNQCRIVFTIPGNTYRIECFNMGSWSPEESLAFEGKNVYFNANTNLPSIPMTIPPGKGLTFDLFGSTLQETTFTFPRAYIFLTTLDDARGKLIYINKMTGSVQVQVP